LISGLFAIVRQGLIDEPLQVGLGVGPHRIGSDGGNRCQAGQQQEKKEEDGVGSPGHGSLAVDRGHPRLTGYTTL